jgi:ABC-2 type transport system ATP-binding protein
MPASIVADRLSKTYSGDSEPALDSLSFKIKPGEVYGFLGANGAGKSTTIRLLMNFIQPSGGSATIGGYDVVKDSLLVKKHTGYLAGDVALYPKVSGRELLDYLALLQGTVDKTYRRKLEARFEAQTNKPIGELSKGNRQKIGILQALMHQPDVLILDEPTSGLDPLMQEAFYDSIREARDRGAAVLMSSHNLAEAQRVCDRIGVVKHGKLIREQTVNDDTELGKPVFRVTFAASSALPQIKRAKHLTLLSQHGADVAVLQPKGELNVALNELSQFEIRDLQTQQLNLEDEFMEFYGDNT